MLYKNDLFLEVSSILDYNTCFLCHFHIFSFQEPKKIFLFISITIQALAKWNLYNYLWVLLIFRNDMTSMNAFFSPFFWWGNQLNAPAFSSFQISFLFSNTHAQDRNFRIYSQNFTTISNSFSWLKSKLINWNSQPRFFQCGNPTFPNVSQISETLDHNLPQFSLPKIKFTKSRWTFLRIKRGYRVVSGKSDSIPHNEGDRNKPNED